jgi:uncharacterized membrane protein HdeD (DUF308 family)
MPDRSSFDALRESRIVAFSAGTILLVAGIVLLVWPDRTLTVVARLVGLLVAVAGVAQILEAVSVRQAGTHWGVLLLRGILNLATGALLLFWPGITITVLVWLAGLNFIITGILGLVATRSVPRGVNRSVLLGQSAIAIIFGLVLVVWPDATVAVVAFVAGIGLALLGLSLLYTGFRLARPARAAQA